MTTEKEDLTEVPGRKRMLKISEMAQLANTTRRTLIFYDEQGVFKPQKTGQNGYRYYDYQQLYDLLFILGLRNLDMPLDKIKAIQAQPSHDATRQLTHVQRDITTKIRELTKIQTVIDQKLAVDPGTSAPTMYVPQLRHRAPLAFWCSQKSASCTEAEVAELFSSFYQDLNELALMDTAQSGFLTSLRDASPADYPEAAFRVIKGAATQSSTQAVPQVIRPEGTFAVVQVENTTAGICHGLTELQQFSHDHHLKLAPEMWQLNVDNQLVTHGGSALASLEYYVQV